MKKGERYPVEVLAKTEVALLFAACSARCATGVRNRALLAVMYRGGLRVSEALSLKPADVDLEGATIRILKGKGSKARTVGLDVGALAMVACWLQEREKRGYSGHQALFCSLKGTRLAASYLRSLMPRLAAKAGITKRVHPHCLRHTHAAELMAEGIPLNVIQRQLGHANLQVTSRYLDHIQPQEVIDAIKSREWTV